MIVLEREAVRAIIISPDHELRMIHCQDPVSGNTALGGDRGR